MAFLKRAWPVILIGVACLLPLLGVLRGQTIGPWAQIATMVPGAPAQGNVGAWDVLQADGAIQFFVWRDLVFEAWRSGQVPFWNPYQLAGTPLLANSQSGALYPPHILVGLLGVPTGSAVAFLAWFHLFLAGVGVYVLVLRLGGVKAGGAIAGVSFATSTFMLSWTGLASVISTLAWVPWALAGVTLSKDRPARATGVTGACVGLMLLAGHLQFAAYGVLATLVWGVWLASTERKPMVLGGTVLALVLGGALAAPHLASSLAYSQFSHRRNVPTEEGYQAYIAGAIRPPALATLAIPNLDGNPRLPMSEELPISEYAPKLSQQGANLAEQALGVGPLVFLLLVLSVFLLPRKHPAWGLAILGGLALLVAFGTPLNRIGFFFVPGWSSTGSPGRILSLFVLAACCLAGVAASALMRGEGKPPLLPKVVGGGAVLALLTLALSQGLSPLPGVDPKLFEVIRSSGLSSAIAPGLGLLILTAGALVWATRERTRNTKATQVILPVISAVAFGGLTLVPTGVPVTTVEPRPEGRVAIVNRNWDLQLVPKAVMPPNLATLMRIEDVAGYDSLLHRDTVAWLKELNAGQDAAPPENGNMMLVKSPAVDALRDAGVSEVWGPASTEGLEDLPGIGTFARQRVPNSFVADVNGVEATITRKTANGFVVEVPAGGTLTVRYRNIPGWTAFAEGKPLAIAEGRWLKVEAPAGRTEFRFESPGFRSGLPFAAFALLAVLALAFLGSRGREPEPKR